MIIDSPQRLARAAAAPGARQAALALCAQGQPAAARRALEQLQTIAPDDAELLSDLAAVTLSSGDHAQAVEYAKRALERVPDHGPAAFTLAMGLTGVGRTDEAAAVLGFLTAPGTGDAFRSQWPELTQVAAQELARLRSGAARVAAPLPPVRYPSTRWTGVGAAKYELDHLDQPADQNVGGPVQDDEALLLYAAVRAMRARRILEIGGLSGYSARNFLRALGDDDGAAVYTVDINPVKSQAPHHYTYAKDVALLTPEDLHHQPIDFIFFDAHVFEPQMKMLDRITAAGLVTEHTVIALHDTHLHPRKSAPWSYRLKGHEPAGYVHQPVERQMVNALRRAGWDAVAFHTPLDRHDARLPFRHGVTIMRKFREMAT
jgi:predicted O-methyltransferase YrrM